MIGVQISEPVLHRGFGLVHKGERVRDSFQLFYPYLYTSAVDQVALTARIEMFPVFRPGYGTLIS